MDSFFFWLLDAVGVSMKGKETKEKQNIESSPKKNYHELRCVKYFLLVCSLSISSLCKMNYIKKKLIFRTLILTKRF